MKSASMAKARIENRHISRENQQSEMGKAHQQAEGGEYRHHQRNRKIKAKYRENGAQHQRKRKIRQQKSVINKRQ